jgi:hypothetical protein
MPCKRSSLAFWLAFIIYSTDDSFLPLSSNEAASHPSSARTRFMIYIIGGKWLRQIPFAAGDGGNRAD